MKQQIVLKATGGGAQSHRVMDQLTPMKGTTAPDVNAEFVGQMWVDTTGSKVYIAVAVGSVVVANDWKSVTIA